MRRKTFSAIVLAICLCLGLGLAFPAFAVPADYDQMFTIVHTNDVHGHVDVEAYVKGYVDALKAAGKDVVVVSAGDAFAGTVFAAHSEGIDVAVVMNMAGYDMFVVGNHEMMMKPEALAAVAKTAEFPFLGCNVSDKVRESVPEIKNYIIKEIGSTKIAFIGIAAILGTTGEYTISAVNKAIADAKAEGATVFIGVSHLGTTDPDETIRTTYIIDYCPGLDAVIDAHCHTEYANGRLYNGVMIGETGEYGNNIGVMEFYLKNGKVVDIEARLIKIKGNEAASGITPDKEIQDYIAGVNAELEYLNEVALTTPVLLQGEREYVRSRETNFGNLVADAMLWKSGADLAFFTGPYIRASLQPGDITRKELNAALYADVDLCLVDLTGEEFLQTLEFGLTDYPALNNGFPHVAGVRVLFDLSRDKGERIVSAVLADGTELDPGKTYSCVVRLEIIDFLAAVTFAVEKLVEGEDYTKLGTTICSALVEYIASGAEIPAEIDGRMQPVAFFNDVASHWAVQSIYAAAAKGLTDFADEAFLPDKAVTKAEIITMLEKFFGTEAELNLPGDWENMKADGTVTRGLFSALVYLLRDYLGLTGNGNAEKGFADITGHWAEKEINFLYANGIINGYGDGTFKPDKAITRAEAVTILMRILQRK